MSASRPLIRCTFAMVVLALMAYGLSSGGLGGAALGIALASLGWWLTEGRSAWAAPKWLIATLLVLVIARGLWTLSTRSTTSISPFLAFLASIIVIKSWEKRSVRDFAQVLSICAFVLIGSALGSNSFGIGAIIAIAFPILVYGGILLQVEAAKARAVQLGRSAADLSEMPRRGPLRLSLGLALLGVALAAGVFVVVPRTQGSPGFAALGLSGSRVSGFRDRVELGRAGLISMSQAVVMEVDVLTGEGLPNVAGPEGELYLRGAVLEEYVHRAGIWRRPSSAGMVETESLVRGERQNLSTSHSDRSGTELRIRDRDRVAQNRPVFSPWRPLSIRHESEATSSVGLEVSPWLSSATFEQAAPGEYYIICTPEPGGSGEGERSPAQVPESEVLRSFAERILREVNVEPDPAFRPVTEDFRAMRALEQYLQQRFTYSRNLLAPPPGASPIEWFLTSAEEGHCEYFAGGLAALARSIGINARVVTGYVTGEFNADRRMYTVRQAGAHAWIEAEIGPGRWRPFDATPAEEISRLAGLESGVLLQVERWFAGLETAWNSRIVNFGQETRGRGVGSGEWTRATLRYLQRGEEFVRRIGIVSILTWGLIVLGGLSLLFAAGGLITKQFVRRWRRRDPLGSAVRGEAAVVYSRTLRAWERLGAPKPPWRGAMEHASTIDGPARELGEGLISLCYPAFFGGRGLPEADATRARDLLKRLEALSRAPRTAL